MKNIYVEIDKQTETKLARLSKYSGLTRSALARDLILRYLSDGELEHSIHPNTCSINFRVDDELLAKLDRCVSKWDVSRTKVIRASLKLGVFKEIQAIEDEAVSDVVERRNNRSGRWRTITKWVVVVVAAWLVVIPIAFIGRDQESGPEFNLRGVSSPSEFADADQRIAEALRDRAFMHQQRGQYAMAESDLRAAYRLFPDDLKTLRHLVEVLNAQAKTEESDRFERLLQKRIEGDADDPAGDID